MEHKHSFLGAQKRVGFTLIEMLVAVLIIGILVATALPQYEKAVEKTRALEAVAMVKQITKAEKLYRLTWKEYTQKLDELDLDIPNLSKEGEYATLSNTKNFIYRINTVGVNVDVLVVTASRVNGPFEYFIHMRADNGIEVMWCDLSVSAYQPPTGDLGTDKASKLCKAVADNNSKGIIYDQRQ